MEFSFNPRARKGRDVLICVYFRHGCNSFNPRARKGRDKFRDRQESPRHRFNPRARKGRDVFIGKSALSPEFVSIHAPVKGATALIESVTDKVLSFNPRARKGRDFLPTLTGFLINCFNPRARKGRDLEAPLKTNLE